MDLFGWDRLGLGLSFVIGWVHGILERCVGFGLNIFEKGSDFLFFFFLMV